MTSKLTPHFFCILLTLLVTSSLLPAACCEREPLPHPLTLEAAESYAVRHNQNITALRDRVCQGQYGRGLARSVWLPFVELSGAVEADSSGEHAYSQKASLSQILYSSSAFYNLPRSDLFARLDETGLASAVNGLLFDVRSKYYEIVLAQEDVAIARENVELLAAGVDRENKRWDLGESTRFNVDQSKVTVANALSDYYQAMRRLKVSRNDLLELLGLDTCEEDDLYLEERVIPVLSIRELAEKIEKFGPDSLESTRVDYLERSFSISTGEVNPAERIFSNDEMWVWEDRALQYRPEIIRACLAKRIAEIDLSDRYGQYHPRVSAFGSVGHESTNRFGFDSGNVEWAGGINMRWTLFDGFGRELRVCDAKTGLHAAAVRYDEQLQVGKLAVRDRFFEMEQALLSYFAASQGVLLAQEAVDLSVNQRDMGLITPLEYRDATRALTQARQNLNQASFALLRSYYGLRRDAGVDVCS